MKTSIRILAAYLLLVAIALVAMLLSDKSEAREYKHAIGYICCSSHVRDKDKDLNEENTGVYYRYNRTKNSLFMVGSFNNSFGRQANFISYGPRWQLGDYAEFVLPIGLTTGYQMGASPFILPTFTIFKTVNVHVIPGVVYAASFNLIRW